MAINLLPWRERQAIRELQRYVTGLLICMIIIVGAGVGARYYLSYLNKHYLSANLHLAQQINDLPIPEDNKKLAADFEMARQQIKLIETVQANQTQFWRDFWWLQQNVPTPIRLTHLSWNSAELRLQAVTAHSGSIGLLVSALENSGLFSQIILEHIDQADSTGAIGFVIHANHRELAT